MKLVAHKDVRTSTPEVYIATGDAVGTNEAKAQSLSRAKPYLTSAKWSADGTSITTQDSSHTVQTHVLPEDLLGGQSAGPHQLLAQGRVTLPEPTSAIALAPYFSISDPRTQTFLAGCRDHPIQLYHAFPNADHAAPLSSYKLIRKETEEYIAPASLLWERDGTHFICGSANRLDYFDITRNTADEPLLTVKTIPSKRHILKGGGVGMKGTVSALSENYGTSCSPLLATGTRTRWLGLYDLHRTDHAVANWSIAKAETALDPEADTCGAGITQVAWSPCGRYLVVNERHATGLLVYDVRGTGQIVSVLQGRNTNTQQTLQCDVFAGDAAASGFEVWAGTGDGTVRVWENVGMQTGLLDSNWSWKAHEAPVGSAVIHPTGSVVATCSGGLVYPEGETDELQDYGLREAEESSLKVWAVS